MSKFRTRLDTYTVHPQNYAHVDGLVQDCSISSALEMEILQFIIKRSI